MIAPSFKLIRSVVALSCLASTCQLACGSSSKSDPNEGTAGAAAGIGAGGTTRGGSPSATSGASPGGNASHGGNGSSGTGHAGAGAGAGAGNAGAGNAGAGNAGAGNAGSSGGGQPAGGSGGAGNLGVPGPTLTDPRDGATYDTVVIKGQTWMAENLNFATATGSWCQNNDPAQCAISGRYYDWSVALGLPIECDMMLCQGQIQAKQQGICPAGWHVTTDDEWYGLFFTPEDCAKAKTSTGWQSGAGNDSYGLRISPTGYRTSDGFLGLGTEALHWTTNDELPNFTLAFGAGTVGCGSEQYAKNFGLSVRCIKD